MVERLEDYGPDASRLGAGCVASVEAADRWAALASWSGEDEDSDLAHGQFAVAESSGSRAKYLVWSDAAS